MNVSAAESASRRPLWRLDGPRTLFVGPLDRNAAHEHGAPVFLAGPYGRFALKVGNGPWRTCRTALIPAGVPHELRLDGDPLGVLYLEPQAEGAPALQALLRDAEEADGALIGHAGETETFRALFDDPASLGWADEAIADLTRFSARRAPCAVDARVRRAANLAAENETARLDQAARAAGLSLSRLQHLFTAEIGVSFRRYRRWTRMRRAIAEIVGGASFTAAAHAAGYADQPHFARDFRRTFGAPASRSLTDVRRAPGW